MREIDVRHFFKQNIFASLTQLFTFIFLMLFNILLARMLGPNDFGIFIVIFSMALTVGMFSDMGLSQVIMKYIGRMVRQKDARAPFYFRHLLKIKLSMMLILFIALYLASDMLAASLLHNASLGWLFKLSAVMAVVYSLLLFFDSFFASLNKYQYSMLANFVSSALRVALPVSFLLLGLGIIGALYGVFISFLLSVAIMGAFFYPLFRKSLLRAPPKTFGLTDFDKFLLYSAGIGILITAYNNLDTFILSFFRSPSEVSFYRTALSIATYAMALLPISGKFLFSAFVAFEEKSKSLMEKAFNKTLRYAIILGIPAIIGVYVLSSKIIVLFYSAEYLPASSALEVLSPLILIILVEILTLNVLMIAGRLKQALIIPAVTVTYSIIGNIALIPAFGYMAAAFNCLVFHIISMSLGIYFCRDLIKIKIDINNLAKTVLSSLAMGLVIVYLLSQMHSIIEIGLTVVAAILVYVLLQIVIGGINKSDISLMQRAVPCRFWGPLMKICRN